MTFWRDVDGSVYITEIGVRSHQKWYPWYPTPFGNISAHIHAARLYAMVPAKDRAAWRAQYRFFRHDMRYVRFSIAQAAELATHCIANV